jgi:hypothetical protein
MSARCQRVFDQDQPTATNPDRYSERKPAGQNVFDRRGPTPTGILAMTGGQEVTSSNLGSPTTKAQVRARPRILRTLGMWSSRLAR